MSDDKLIPDHDNESDINQMPDTEETKESAEITTDELHKITCSTENNKSTNEPFVQIWTEEDVTDEDKASVKDKIPNEDKTSDEDKALDEEKAPDEDKAPDENATADENREPVTTGGTASSVTEKDRKFKFTRNNIICILRLLCVVGFIVFTALFINEAVIQPYRSKKDIDYTRDLYHSPEEDVAIASSPTPAASPTPVPDAVVVTPTPTPVITQAPTPTPDPNRDEQGRLLQFKELLAENQDVKGWISIPDTNIDYVVMQSGREDPEFYLNKGFDKEYSKAGTLFLDIRSSVEEDTQSLLIHGHNMVTTKEKMFRSILKYKEGIKFYKNHPLIQFDTIYHTGTWKVFAVFITPPDPERDYFFEYRTSTFADASDFLNFVYQIRIRSLINVDAVDINENDRLLMLSTCSYEANDRNYRTVLVARKVRDGESTEVNVDRAAMNKNPLYARDYYDENGGKAPVLPATFEEALADGKINWYTPSKELITE